MKKKLLLLFMVLLAPFVIKVQALSQDIEKKVNADKEVIGVLIKDPINGVFVANGMEKIRDILLGSQGEKFMKMTPLQQKNYLQTEEGKSKVIAMNKERNRLFSTTWCFAVNPCKDGEVAVYDLDLKKIMIELGLTSSNKVLEIGGNVFKFKKEYQFTSKLNILNMVMHYLGISCTEEVALKIENNANNLRLYVYFKVPSMNCITNLREMRNDGSMPNLSVNIDRFELRNFKTNEIYLSK